jgi:hypothetical protein
MAGLQERGVLSAEEIGLSQSVRKQHFATLGAPEDKYQGESLWVLDGCEQSEAL